MQADNLRYTLLDKLISIRDIHTLEKVNAVLGNVDVNTPIFKVTGAQWQMLASSEEDIRNGHIASDDELNAQEDRWLNR